MISFFILFIVFNRLQTSHFASIFYLVYNPKCPVIVEVKRDKSDPQLELVMHSGEIITYNAGEE
jgi:hypothetical protein